MKTIYNSGTRKAGSLFILMILALFMMSCTKNSLYGDSGNNNGGPGANEVWIQNMSFNPSSITVTAGTTIKWTNKDAVAHTVTSNSGAFDSGSMSTGATFSYQFATAGTYSYHCTFHAGMTGKVTAN